MAGEKNLSALLTRSWRGCGAHVTRIETAVGRGVPDLEVCYEGISFWAELKNVRGLIVMDPKRPEQATWLRQRRRAHGLAWVIARKGDTIRLWDGSLAHELLKPGAWNDRRSTCYEWIPPYDYLDILSVCVGGTQ